MSANYVCKILMFALYFVSKLFINVHSLKKNKMLRIVGFYLIIKLDFKRRSEKWQNLNQK